MIAHRTTHPHTTPTSDIYKPNKKQPIKHEQHKMPENYTKMPYHDTAKFHTHKFKSSKKQTVKHKQYKTKKKKATTMTPEPANSPSTLPPNYIVLHIQNKIASFPPGLRASDYHSP